jgi:subtilisin family serine protease
MAAKKSRRCKSRNRVMEVLEERCVMAGDSFEQLPGGRIDHHALENNPIEHHGAIDDAPQEQPMIGGSPLLELHGELADEPPPLVRHGDPSADFWNDLHSERDVESLLGEIEKALAQAHGMTGLTQVRNNYGFIGTGQTVAIIDSGIAFDHWALGGGFGANYRVVGGYDFAENDANPYDDGPEGSHGTHVSGIVGADRTGTVDDGVAPGVDLVGLRVFDDFENGYFSWVESALQWVHQNRNSFENPITAVNLSIGSAWNSTSVPYWSTLEDEFAQLKADGIFITCSAGNSFTNYNTPGLSYPAASPHVVPVMCLDDNGSFSYFSQRHPTALAAPGRWIVSTVPDYIGNNNGVTDDFASFSGTSMAAPYVAGASVILREAMQFLGYTNITQTTLFNHMMATADTFFDSLTGLNYKRLNLNNAISTLMPSDDYGSTDATAYNLGTLSGTSEIGGLIGALSDSDYFRFIAAGNGTVSFTASTTHALAPVWTGAGGTVSNNGRTFTFDVVAGQSYTFGLSTSGGIGYYDLAIEAESGLTFVDWGTITQSHVNNVVQSGEKWHRVQASRSGYLTAETLFAAAGGNVDIAWYNSDLQLLATGVANASGERVEVAATAGTEYFLRVVGSNSDVDFRLTNLVSQSGSAVSVAGTTASDTFTFSAGATQHAISVNGAAYSFAKAGVATISFTGDTGSDNITMTGSTGNDTATLLAGNATLTGSGYSISATAVESVTVHGGGGSDEANLYDSSADDTFTARSSETSMLGGGYSSRVISFGRADGYATSGGYDKAEFFDTAGDDTFTARPNENDAFLNSAGFFSYAKGFERVNAYATSGGYDKAEFLDTAGDDTFTARPNENDAFQSSPGIFSYAKGFERVNAYATSGGYDKAEFFDTAGDDTFTARPNENDAFLSSPGIFSYAKGFERLNAYATSGGYDQAMLYDSAADDVVTFRPAENDAFMSSPGIFSYTKGFERINAYATAGGFDRVEFFDTFSNDTLTFRPNQSDAFLSALGIFSYAQGFERVNGYATLGGYDKAEFYDTSADDVFTLRPEAGDAFLYAAGIFSYAQGFERVNAYATAGGYDKVDFYDTSSDDVFTARPSEQDAFLNAAGIFNYAVGFERINAYATAGGYDRVDFYDTTGNDVFTSRPNENDAFMSSPGQFMYATGFDRVNAYATSAGYDVANFYDTAGNDTFTTRPAEFDAFMSTPTIFAYAKGFERYNSYATAGGYDSTQFFGTAGDDNFVGRANQTDAYMQGAGYFNYVKGFERVDASAGSGGFDSASLYDSPGDDSVDANGSTASLFSSVGDYHVTSFDQVAAHSVAGGNDSATVGTIDFIFEQLGAWN